MLAAESRASHPSYSPEQLAVLLLRHLVRVNKWQRAFTPVAAMEVANCAHEYALEGVSLFKALASATKPVLVFMTAEDVVKVCPDVRSARAELRLRAAAEFAANLEQMHFVAGNSAPPGRARYVRIVFDGIATVDVDWPIVKEWLVDYYFGSVGPRVESPSEIALPPDVGVQLRFRDF